MQEHECGEGADLFHELLQTNVGLGDTADVCCGQGRSAKIVWPIPDSSPRLSTNVPRASSHVSSVRTVDNLRSAAAKMTTGALRGPVHALPSLQVLRDGSADEGATPSLTGSAHMSGEAGAIVDWKIDSLIHLVFGRMVAVLPRFFNLSRVCGRSYFQRGRMDAGSDLTRKARAKRAMLLGCEMRLWQAHVLDGKNQALCVLVAAAGGTYADCVASTQDVALHHRSFSTLHALYRRRLGRGAKQAEMVPL